MSFEDFYGVFESCVDFYGDEDMCLVSYGFVEPGDEHLVTLYG